MELNIFSKDNEKRNKTTNRLHLTIDNVDVSIVNALQSNYIKYQYSCFSRFS